MLDWVQRSFLTGRLRINLNPLNPVRWINSWPFDKTWTPDWNDSTQVNRFNGRAMNLEWIFIMTPSRVRKLFSKALRYFFLQTFVRTEYGYDGDGFNAVRFFRVNSEDSAERFSLDESSAFLIEGAHWQSTNQKHFAIGLEKTKPSAHPSLSLCLSSPPDQNTWMRFTKGLS